MVLVPRMRMAIQRNFLPRHVRNPRNTTIVAEVHIVIMVRHAVHLPRRFVVPGGFPSLTFSRSLSSRAARRVVQHRSLLPEARQHHPAEVQRTNLVHGVVSDIPPNYLVREHLVLLNQTLSVSLAAAVAAAAAAAPFGPYGAFMPENFAAFAAGLNNAFAGNPAAAAAASRSTLNDLYSAMRIPAAPPASLITSANAAASGNLLERNGTKQHYSFQCDSYDPSPSSSALQPFTFPSDAFEASDCPRRTKILSHLLHGDVVCAVTISDLNKHIYTGGKGCVKIWDLKESTASSTSPTTISKPIGQFECLVRGSDSTDGSRRRSAASRAGMLTFARLNFFPMVTR